MPNFDTRRPDKPRTDTPRPQKPDRPNRLHLAVDPSRQHLALGVLILVLLVVIPVILLENEIQFETTPEYHLLSENDAFLPDEGGITGCAADYCHMVFTEATSPVQLAAITADVEFGSTGATGVEFNHKSMYRTHESAPIGSGYCFNSKGGALSALHLRLWTAKLLGTIDDCYIVVL
jgi:hypothetical protein